jgi:hypothetical protein
MVARAVEMSPKIAHRSPKRCISEDSTYEGRRLETCFCGFILIFEDMSMSQLEIDNSSGQQKSELWSGARSASEGTKHLSQPPRAQRAS